MSTLKYKVIKTTKQYDQYCEILYNLVFSEKRTEEINEEIELLNILTDYWSKEHYPIPQREPVVIIRSYMKDEGMKAKDLAELLGVNKSYVSDILNYKKGLSKEVIRKLAERFKIRQDVLNRPYRLDKPNKKKSKPRAKPKPAKVVSTRKKIRKAV